MPKASPLISLNEFLNESMKSELIAQLNQFIELWSGSESLRFLIRQIVNEPKHKSSEHPSKLPRESRRPSTSNSVQTLIDEHLVSPILVAENLAQLYGGLDRKNLLVLLERYKAGSRDLSVYMLVRGCKRALAKEQAIDIRLKRITLDLISLAIKDNRADFFQEIADTIEFFRKEEYRAQDQWNHDPGQWWQFHILLYILENPKPMYPIREFVKHFKEEVGSQEMPTTKTIRKFCRTHGIALDSKPGAPKRATPI